MAKLWRRIRFRSRRAELDEELSAEMEQHIELLVRDFIAKGKTETEARRAAATVWYGCALNNRKY